MTAFHARLVVSDADGAIDFYQRAFGATLQERYRDDTIGRVVHAALAIDGVVLTLSDEDPDHGTVSPTRLGGSPVILQLTVDDPDAVGARMEAAGAEVVFPIADQFYGHREGRLRDPFGHLWILSKVLETLAPEEIQRRVDSFHDDG